MFNTRIDDKLIDFTIDVVCQFVYMNDLDEYTHGGLLTLKHAIL